jgi:hypothetical protein
MHPIPVAGCGAGATGVHQRPDVVMRHLVARHVDHGVKKPQTKCA